VGKDTLEKLGDIIIDRSRNSDSQFWQAFRKSLDDPKFPVRDVCRTVGTPIGIHTDWKGEFIDISGFMVTGMIQVSVRELRGLAIRIQFREDFLSVTFRGHPEWISKSAYREQQPLVSPTEKLQ
jgi:hypothetical protein